MNLTAWVLADAIVECLSSAKANNRAAWADWDLGGGNTLGVTVHLPQGPVTSQTIKVEAKFGPSGKVETVVIPYMRTQWDPTKVMPAARTILRSFLKQAR